MVELGVDPLMLEGRLEISRGGGDQANATVERINEALLEFTREREDLFQQQAGVLWERQVLIGRCKDRIPSRDGWLGGASRREELSLENLGRQSLAVEMHEGLIPRRSEPMNRPRGVPLARPRLADNQHGDPARSREPYLLK